MQTPIKYGKLIRYLYNHFLKFKITYFGKVDTEHKKGLVQ